MTQPKHIPLLAGSYAAPDQPGIYAFLFDPATGALAARETFAGITNPSFLTVHPNGRWLYAVGETAEGADSPAGAVCALRFQQEPWRFELVNQAASGGDYPCHLQLDATGKWLFVANYGSGTLAVLPVREDGSLGEMSDMVRHEGSGPNAARQEGPHAHSTVVSPDNRFVIAADLGIDQLVIYQFDAANGRLQRHGHVETRPGAGPRHSTFHPNGRVLYVANELDNTVSVYEYDAANGMLRELETHSTLPEGAPENTVADIHLSPAGDRLIVSNRGHNSLALFDVASSGELTPGAIVSCGGDWPRNFAWSPDGGFVLVANQYSGDVAVLPANGMGEAVARVDVPKASCVRFF